MDNTPLHHIETLRAAGFWPDEEKLNSERWLTNFDEDDIAAAKVLLRSFIFVSDKVVDALLVDAYISLLGHVKTNECKPPNDGTLQCRKSNFVFTFPTGEIPHCTDSGYSFVRKVRQLFGVDEQHIMEPSDALNYLLQYNEEKIADTDLVLVDDFAGTGQQLSKTLNRLYKTPVGQNSIHHLANSLGLRVHYCVLAVTSEAKKYLRHKHRYLSLHCPHVLGDRYSVRSSNTALVPQGMRNAVKDLIEKYSERYMRSDSVPEYVHKYGYCDLGLTIAFQHSVPDATLPIFWAQTDDWHPLYRRS